MILNVYIVLGSVAVSAVAVWTLRTGRFAPLLLVLGVIVWIVTHFIVVFFVYTGWLPVLRLFAFAAEGRRIDRAMLAIPTIVTIAYGTLCVGVMCRAALQDRDHS